MTDNQKDGDVVHAELFVARGKSAPLLKTIEAKFDAIPVTIPFYIKFYEFSTIAPCWNYRHDATLAQSSAEPIAIVSIIARKMRWTEARTTATTRRIFPMSTSFKSCGESCASPRVFVNVESVAACISSEMYLRTEPAAATAKGYESPFFPPAAC